jgi:hypothetical protein
MHCDGVPGDYGHAVSFSAAITMLRSGWSVFVNMLQCHLFQTSGDAAPQADAASPLDALRAKLFEPVCPNSDCLLIQVCVEVVRSVSSARACQNGAACQGLRSHVYVEVSAHEPSNV